jgi:Ni-sirohydrochlorin a,c-diamide synthase
MTNKSEFSIPRVLIAADRSSAGKTTIAVGLMSIFTKRGCVVQPFKVGLDYIDPSYHSKVTGRYSRNLDGFLMNRQAIADIFSHAARGADIGIIEGVRGLYEGLESTSDIGTTAEIAKTLRSPVILVVDARSITRSAAALVEGYRSFDREVDISGVILNYIGSPAHAAKAKEAIEHYTEIEVIGQIPRTDAIRLTMRHLGLVPATEGQKRDTTFEKRLENIEAIIRDCVDIDKVFKIAANAAPMPLRKQRSFVASRSRRAELENKVRIGIAYDEAFNFYYNDLFDLFSLNGAELVFFSPLHDEEVLQVDGIYLGGGYPELFGSELEHNRTMRESIVSSAQAGMPIFAECGGLMYLTESLTYGGQTSRMAGVIPASTTMVKDRVIGYVSGTTIRDTVIGPKGTQFRGHEFHYSTLTETGRKLTFAFALQKGRGISGGCDGIQVQRTLASYTHIHPLSYPNLAHNFTQSCAKFKDQTIRNRQSLE